LILRNTKNQARPVFLWGPVVVAMAAIFYVSSLPDAPLPEDVSDKSGHVMGYTALGATVVRAVAGGLPRRITLRIAAIAIAMTVAYGATDELHQAMVPGRTAELADVYADAAGATLAAIACWAWGIIWARRVPPRGHDDV
jgi:VanZ family protein